MKEVKRYQCDHCDKVFASKSYTLKHEDICFYNPQTKSCITCKNFIPEIQNNLNDRECSIDMWPLKNKLKTNCNGYVFDEMHREIIG